MGLFPEIFFAWNFFYFKFYNSEFIYICNKKYFSFPKNFFICNKKIFLRRNFNFFVPKIFKFFLQKNRQKSPKKIFQSVFWPKCEKNFDQGSRRTFRNHQFGFEKIMKCLKKNENCPLFLFFFFFFCFQNFFLHGFFLFQIL